MPKNLKPTETIFEVMINEHGKYENYKPEMFKVPKNFDISVKFPQMLIPTMDSVRACNLLETLLFSQNEEDINAKKKNVLVLGDGGTAKSSTVLLMCEKYKDDMMIKKTNFSSATTPFLLQLTIESVLVSKGNK